MDECCAHIEALKQYLEKKGLYITGADEQVYIECERCEIDVAVTDLYAVAFDAEVEVPEEDDVE